MTKITKKDIKEIDGMNKDFSDGYYYAVDKARAFKDFVLPYFTYKERIVFITKFNELFGE